MLTSLRNRIATLVATLALAIVPAVAVPVAVSAQTTTDISGNLKCGSNLNTDSTGGSCDVATGTKNVSDIVKQIVNIFSAIVGIVSVIMIIYAGFKYVTSGGDSGNVGTAKNTIIYAVIGLVVVAFAQFIVQFVLGKVAPSA